MGGSVLSTNVKEKDLRLAVYAGMKVSERQSNSSINYVKSLLILKHDYTDSVPFIQITTHRRKTYQSRKDQ